MSVSDKSVSDYSRQKNNIPTRYKPVNRMSRRDFSTQTEHEPSCVNGCLSRYIDASHEQETDHSDSRVNTNSYSKPLNDMENVPSQSKEVYSDVAQRDDNSCTSNSLDNVRIQDYPPTVSGANTGMDSSSSDTSKDFNIGINTEHGGYGQSHTVDMIDERGVICVQVTSDNGHCIVEKTYFRVEPKDSRRKENSAHEARMENSKQQPANRPNSIQEPSSNVLSTREDVNEMSERERIHAYVKAHKCSYCNKVFARQFNLKVHERIHTGVKPYKCTYCSKAFSRQGKLKEHERTHTGVKPYKCTICDKLFTVESNLKVHERIHTGVKPYKCTICKKEFTVKCSLKKHERLHTGVRPYECTYCGKTFTVKYSLKEHESIHTGVKPFKCTYCDKAFVRQVRLRKHERIHTGVKPFMCA